jgi:hypothetical protein
MREVTNVESRVEQVTVFARGARVRRVATIAGPVPQIVRLVGLPLAVIDHTVRAEIAGDAATVTMLRTGVDTPGGEARAEESGELRVARTRQAIAQSEVERLEAALDRVATASIVEDDPSDEPPAAWSAVVAARRTLVTLRAEREHTLRQGLALARRELDAAQRAFAVAHERDIRSGSARIARLHELRKHVELDLAAGPASGPIVIRVEYQIAAARWAPSYVARLDADAARFELRAIVAQDSGEDWTGVALVLSTAEPDHFSQLPELPPQKIGRRQAEPARRGFRPPPAGADALYGDYDAGFPRRPPTTPEMPFGAVAAELSSEVWDEDSSRAKEAYGTPPPAPPPRMAMPAPMRASKKGASVGAAFGAAPGAVAMAAQSVMPRNAPGDGGGGAARERAAPLAPTPRLDYGSLKMAGPTSHDRGKLVAAPPAYDAGAMSHVHEASASIGRLALPAGHAADWIHTYDYAFASDGTVDVASDGAWHSLALTSRAGTAAIRHVAVPREQADVFRVAAIANPFDGPLLPGPIDVYDRGQFLVTSTVDDTPPGGTVEVGLGVDASVKVARNAEFREEAAGMLKGKLELHHTISIDVENLSARPISLEVRERVPVAREEDDEITVALGKVEPAWERWTPDPTAPRAERLRGGYRWKLDVPARAKKQLRASYDVKIAGKLELVGGNRREP